VKGRHAATQSPAPELTNLPHLPALDGLRGLAVAAVLLFHGDHLTGGFLGVDLFFVLSGFLITSLLLAEARSGRIDIVRFWSRRARRLLPALAIVLCAVAGYAALFARPEELSHIRFDGLATAFYFVNWRDVVDTQTYWDLFIRPSPLAHTWSLAIEEQFYVVWPLLIAAVVAWRTRAQRAVAPAVFVLCAVLGVASLAAMLALYRADDTNRVYFGTDTRAASILVGASLAAWLAWRGRPQTSAGWRGVHGAALTGVAVLAYAWTHVDGTSATVYRGGFFVCALAAAAIIAGTLDSRPTLVNRALRFPALVGLGIISYGVYLWHWPIFVVVDSARTGISGWPLLGLRVTMTVGIAIVSYAAIEHPIRRGAFTAATLRRVTPAMAAVVVVTLVASTIRPGSVVPLEDRKPDTPAIALAAAATAPPTAKRLLIVGNSVGFSLADGFKTLPEDQRPVVFNAALPSCVFPSGVTRTRNELEEVWRRRIVDCAPPWADDVTQFQPDVALLVLGDFGDGAYEHDGHWLEPCTNDFDTWYRESLRAAVHTLGAPGNRVAISTSAYAYGVFGPSRFAKDDCVNAIDREVAAESPNTVLVDLATYICPTKDTCRTEQDGIELRPDGIHFLDDSARLIATWMLPQLTKPD
jgi:peptidoglycan/LPS O-acetylase OafA/YrhL